MVLNATENKVDLVWAEGSVDQIPSACMRTKIDRHGQAAILTRVTFSVIQLRGCQPALAHCSGVYRYTACRIASL